jgi:alpha-muurolene/germacrene-A/gamma-muurolene/(+)-delta-cadinol synthase
MVTSNSRVSSFRLPDLQCPFPLKYHENGDTIAAASDEWFANGSSNFTESRRRRLNGLKAGQLTAYCYNKTSDHRLKVVCDFMNFVFHMDDLSDSLQTKDTIILADLVMNAFDSPHFYHRTLPDGRELPEEEPDASKLARE